MRVISTINAPQPFGHYSQAVHHEGLIYLSGQLPALPEGSHRPDDPFPVQAQRVLDHVVAILSSAGASPAHVLKVTAYIVGVQNWPVFNTLYADVFGDSRPARSVVPVSELHHGYLIELDAVAFSPRREQP